MITTKKRLEDVSNQLTQLRRDYDMISSRDRFPALFRQQKTISIDIKVLDWFQAFTGFNPVPLPFKLSSLFGFVLVDDETEFHLRQIDSIRSDLASYEQQIRSLDIQDNCLGYNSPN